MRVKHPIRTMLRVVFRKAPVEAQLIVTRKCNLSCGYCAEYDKVSEFIPLDVLKRRIDALHRLRVVNIAMLGGEPLMHCALLCVYRDSVLDNRPLHTLASLLRLAWRTLA